MTYLKLLDDFEKELVAKGIKNTDTSIAHGGRFEFALWLEKKAAAPDLLQSLELALRFLDHPETKAIPFAMPVDGVIQQARAAIARARGEHAPA